ncbi:hypothetical protein A3J19_02495 [Candidatus Daviesbacteria bacterium RIFCSPLOWO2_02_FULL_41_8]|uniref:DUF86 domain-containing protein n=2 Tax=Candidatus Daviesiibacteriota TaxID=1752718 RepID=A0A1F5NGD0_9BACT|nr:MAG: hypothetical protein A2871_02205 [Candidatus Daviesbacteria bacterium RIFCSPHIGHO2_01_FULL_41_23]OGE76717.1 MAG: hypothetical protein A3J19_02495 [Candidatus Daviesbacteria bacterium RIFCSPLOWO2_02_FULL_41_8]
MKKDPSVFLKHILECIDLIGKYSKNFSKKDFKDNGELQDAIIRRLEIIGEAARNLPDEFKSNYSDIEWRRIIAARNILAHFYFGIDLNTIWNIVENDLPPLKEQIKKMLKQ